MREMDEVAALRRKRCLLLASGILAILVCVNYWPVFTGKVPLPNDVITRFPSYQGYRDLPISTPHAELGDTITQFYPWRTSSGQSIRNAVLPLWNPLLLAGTPFQANMLSALFYPPNWLFAVIPSPPAAWTVSLML